MVYFLILLTLSASGFNLEGILESLASDQDNYLNETIADFVMDRKWAPKLQRLLNVTLNMKIFDPNGENPTLLSVLEPLDKGKITPERVCGELLYIQILKPLRLTPVALFEGKRFEYRRRSR